MNPPEKNIGEELPGKVVITLLTARNSVTTAIIWPACGATPRTNLPREIERPETNSGHFPIYNKHPINLTQNIRMSVGDWLYAVAAGL